LPGDPTAYGVALSTLQAYLNTWSRAGAIEAAKEYLTTDPPPTNNPVLEQGAVVAYKPSSQQTADQFTLVVTMDLTFKNGDGLAFANGKNSRYVTFSRPDSQGSFRMSLATSP
jgi:hypothetical protein